MSIENKVWSDNEEGYSAESLGELIDNNEDLRPGHVVTFGDAVHPTIERLCSANDVIDTMGDRAYDVAGEYADGFPRVDKAAVDELNALLQAWLDKHAEVNFYEVSNVTKYTLTEDDFDEDQLAAMKEADAKDAK